MTEAASDPTRQELDRISAGFEEAAAPFRRAGRAVGPTVATDDTGTVEVHLDRHGNFTSIRLDNGWERALGGAGALGPAVVATYRRAVAERAKGWGEDLSQEAAGRPVEPQAPSSPARFVSTQIPDAVRDALQAKGDVDPTQLYAGIVRYMEAVEQAVDRALADADRLMDTRITGRSNSGRVTAVVTATGELEQISYDASWAPTAHPYNLSREAVEAYDDARRRAAAENPHDARRELDELTGDPSTFLDFVRLS